MVNSWDHSAACALMQRKPGAERRGNRAAGLGNYAAFAAGVSSITLSTQAVKAWP